MLYLSTRGDPGRKRFCEILLEGLAPDGGLYLPERYPTVDASALQRLREAFNGGRAGGYAALAFEVLSLYIDDIPAADLRALCEKTYTEAVFGTPQIVPLKTLEAPSTGASQAGFYLEALSNGPTLAFKDMAMQLLGNLFEYELARRGEELNILGATSGDTGSAAEYAMRGKKGVRVFMLSPHGRMSPFQQAQMFSLMDENIHNIAIEGVFDDCQDIVKNVSNDLAFKREHKIGTVNSINWARLMAQVVYYFYAALRLGGPERKIAFSVPTGNFGDVFAGYVAAQMGLPIERLIVATNINDILHRALSKGDYSVLGVTPTAAPSMDIQVSSNFERLLFDLEGRDGSTTAARMKWFEQMGKMVLSPEMRKKSALLSSARADGDQMSAAMRWAYGAADQIIDPHTAIALHAARAASIPGDVPLVTLATAHPAKFPDAVERATGVRPHLPRRIGDLFDRQERFETLPNDYQAVRDHIAGRAVARHG